MGGWWVVAGGWWLVAGWVAGWLVACGWLVAGWLAGRYPFLDVQPGHGGNNAQRCLYEIVDADTQVLELLGLGRECAMRTGSAVHDPIGYDAARREEPSLGFTRSSNNAHPRLLQRILGTMDISTVALGCIPVCTGA